MVKIKYSLSKENYMKILVINADSLLLNGFKYGDIVPKLQTGYILSLLEKENYKYSFLDCRLVNNINNTLNFYKDTDIAIISFNTYDYKFAFKLAEFFREKIVIGIGPHASSLPHTIIYENSPFDYVLRGECEYDLIRLIENINNKEELSKIKSLYTLWKKESAISIIDNLDNLPYPKYHLFNGKYYDILPVNFLKKAKWGYVNASRGCPNLCTYCSPMNRISYNYKYRTRSAKNVVDEIEYLTSLDKNVIEFIDDNFTASKKFVMEICDEIRNRELKIKWTAQAKIDTLNKDIINNMKDAGCFCIRTGVESGSNKLIKDVKKYDGDWKKIVIENFRHCKDAGIIIDAYIILGLPNETSNDREETLSMLKKSKPDLVQVHYFKPYPGSKLYNDVDKDNFNEYMYHYNCSLEEFKKTKNEIYKIVYFNPRAVIRHLTLFTGFYLRNPKIFLRLTKFLLN